MAEQDAERPQPPGDSEIVVCTNRRLPPQASCAGRGSVALADYLESEVARRGLPASVRRIICLGHCQKGPTVRRVPGGRFLFAPQRHDLDELLDEMADPGLPLASRAD
ncbi:hypothetical protein JCM17960_24530 [Magnetospira thiophila]